MWYFFPSSFHYASSPTLCIFPFAYFIFLFTFTPLSHSPTHIHPTHLPTHPHAKKCCVGMRGDVPTNSPRKMLIYFHPHKRALVDYSSKPPSPRNPHAIFLNFDLKIIDSRAIYIWNLCSPHKKAPHSIPTQSAMFGTRPHAKFWPGVGLWDRGVLLI